MRAVDVEARRAAILGLAAQGLRGCEIARQLGCRRGPVYQALAAGAATDGRRRAVHRLRIDPAVAATIAELAAEDRSTGDILDLVLAEHGRGAVSESTVIRLARRHRPSAAKPRADVEAEDLTAALAADPCSLAPEIALLRAHLRWLAGQIATPRQTRRRRGQLVRLSVRALELLIRLGRLTPGDASPGALSDGRETRPAADSQGARPAASDHGRDHRQLPPILPRRRQAGRARTSPLVGQP